MSGRSRLTLLARSVFAWTTAWVFAAALYLLLIDITDLPELIVGAVAAALAATGAELARHQRIVGESIRLRWFLRSYRPLLKVPVDIALVSWSALEALVRPARRSGVFRSVAFASSEDDPRASGRRALAVAFGSFAPNTIIVGVDSEGQRMLAHQLRRSGGSEAIDLLELR